MKKFNKTICLVLVYNIVVLVIFAALSIIFGRWWISLFGILALRSYKLSVGKCRTCDGCGVHGPIAETQEEAIRLSEKAGWKHYTGSNTDYCPDCQAHDMVRHKN